MKVNDNIDGSMDPSTNANQSHGQKRASQNIHKIFESFMQLPSEECHFHFLEKRMESVANEFKTTLTSTTLGLDHPIASSFQQLQDEFGHTLERERDFLERMVTRKCSYASSSYVHFPTPTQGSSGSKIFNDELDRDTRRDSGRNPKK